MRRGEERGAVSIFIVIFFAVFLSVITVGFISIVLRSQQQSINTNLSQSAYDSAQAGIEDAKRAIYLTGQTCGAGAGTPACNAYQSKLASGQCDTLADPSAFAGASALKLDSDGTSVHVQNAANATLDQAYTCVTIEQTTDDYVNSESDGTSDLIALSSTADFSSIRVNWFTPADAGLSSAADKFTFPGGVKQLPPKASWGTKTPSILRVELIEYPNGALTNTTLESGMRTLFLYPVGGGSGPTPASFDADTNRQAVLNNQSGDGSAPIVGIGCNAAGSIDYACSAELSLGSGLATSAGHTLYLRVTPIYAAKTTFQVQLKNGSSPVQFNGVEPLVDSTGRANDLFRRVQARVKQESTVLYPEYSVDSSGSFCKTFSVGETAGDYNQGTCTN